MNKSGKISRWIYSGLFLLAAACTSITGMQAILLWRTDRLALPEFFLCCRFMQTSSGFHLSEGNYLQLGLFAAISLVSAVLLLKIGRTQRTTKRLVNFAPVQTWPDKVKAFSDPLHLEQGKVRVLKSGSLFAFCSGIFRPKVYLSTALIERLPSKQLEAVLLHELSHLRHYDPLRILLADTLSSLFFFFPVVRELAGYYKASLELRADKSAISSAGKSALAGALAQMLAPNPPVTPFEGLAVAGLSANAARVAALLGENLPAQIVSKTGLIQSTISMGVICMLIM